MQISSYMRPAVTLFLAMSLLTGIVYPISTTIIGQTLFHEQVNGSLIIQDDKVVGSALIGQNFSQAGYLWGRPSATTGFSYNPKASAASHLSVTHPEFSQQLKKRIEALTTLDYENTLPIPVDLVTASASGLDPHISVAAAMYQVERIAKARNISSEQVKDIIQKYTYNPQFGIFGQKIVHVLQVNLALQALVRDSKDSVAD